MLSWELASDFKSLALESTQIFMTFFTCTRPPSTVACVYMCLPSLQHAYVFYLTHCIPCTTSCWLWSLIIFLIQRSLFSTMFIPHEDFTPWKNVHSSTWGSAGGVTPPRPGPRRGSGVKPPKEKLPCKCIL
jgi:hypothetical protein